MKIFLFLPLHPTPHCHNGWCWTTRNLILWRRFSLCKVAMLEGLCMLHIPGSGNVNTVYLSIYAYVSQVIYSFQDSWLKYSVWKYTKREFFINLWQVCFKYIKLQFYLFFSMGTIQDSTYLCFRIYYDFSSCYFPWCTEFECIPYSCNFIPI
jgi:hypothetical protein